MRPFLVSEGVAKPPAAQPVPISPLHFRPLVGPTSEIRMRPSAYRPADGVTLSQKAGLRYESQFQRFMSEKFGDLYVVAPFIHFLDRGVARTVQPDGLLMFSRHIFVIEVKYQHMPEAWWQSHELYRPLVRLAYPEREVSCLEVCRSYDPSVPFPSVHVLVPDLDAWVSEPRQTFGVLNWRP